MAANIHRKALPLAGAASAAMLAVACSTAPPPPQALAGDRQCFLPQQVRSFQPVDDDTVHVSVGANTVYELELVGTCPFVDWSQQIAIQSRGSSWVCRGYDAELLVPSAAGGVDECAVTAVRRLTEVQANAIREAND